MNKLQNWLVNRALKKYNADEKILELIEKGKIKMVEEERVECDHQKLIKVMRRNLWYQCQNHKCAMIFYVHGADGYYPNDIDALTKSLRRELKLDKNKKTKVVDSESL